MADKARIVEVYLSGLSILDTALKLNTCEKTVRKHVLAAGVMRPAGGHNRHTRERAGADRAMLGAA